MPLGLWLLFLEEKKRSQEINYQTDKRRQRVHELKASPPN